MQSLRAKHLVVAVGEDEKVQLCDLGGRVTVQDRVDARKPLEKQ